MGELIMFSFLKKKEHPIKGRAYAVTVGDYFGEMLVFVEESTEYNFLSLPNMVNRAIPKDKFHFGLENKIVDDVKQIPDKFFKVVEAQYKVNTQTTK